jgi:hypothetical protein
MTVEIFAIMVCLTNPPTGWPTDRVCQLHPVRRIFETLEECDQFRASLPVPPITHEVFCVKRNVEQWERT